MGRSVELRFRPLRRLEVQTVGEAEAAPPISTPNNRNSVAWRKASPEAVGQTASGEALRHATELRLFGVEIGGPEDGFSLTNRLHFESAQRTEANFIDLRPIWSTLEPKPGEYDWSSLDAGLSNAAAVGLPVTITLRFFDRQVPEWLVGENMLDQDGRTHFGYSGFESRCPSYWGPQARGSYLRLIAAMVQRYRTNRAILAWQFFYGYNDSFYLGMWQNRETIYDYSGFSQAKYARVPGPSAEGRPEAAQQTLRHALEELGRGEPAQTDLWPLERHARLARLPGLPDVELRIFQLPKSATSGKAGGLSEVERLKAARSVRTLVEHAFALAPSSLGAALSSIIDRHNRNGLTFGDTPLPSASRCSPLLIPIDDPIPLL